MNRQERRVGDVGVPLRVEVQSAPDVPKDISNVTSMTIYLIRPGSLTTLTKVGSLVSDGTDGLFQALTAASDLSAEGRYSYVGRWQTATEDKWTGPYHFWVVDPLGTAVPNP